MNKLSSCQFKALKKYAPTHTAHQVALKFGYKCDGSARSSLRYFHIPYKPEKPNYHQYVSAVPLLRKYAPHHTIKQIAAKYNLTNIGSLREALCRHHIDYIHTASSVYKHTSYYWKYLLSYYEQYGFKATLHNSDFSYSTSKSLNVALTRAKVKLGINSPLSSLKSNHLIRAVVKVVHERDYYKKHYYKSLDTIQHLRDKLGVLSRIKSLINQSK